MTDNPFIQRHFAIDKKRYLQIRDAYKTDFRLSLKEIAPTLENWYPLFKKVGKQWNWHRRPKYLDQDSIKERLSEDKTRLYTLKLDNDVIGFCLVTKYDGELSTAFNEIMNGYHRDQICEIENFGLFPEHNGQGYGQYFLPMVFAHLFQDCEHIYLASRDTNHEGVKKFYTRLGMVFNGQDRHSDDLVPESSAKLEKFNHYLPA